MFQIHRVVKLNTSFHFAVKVYGGVKVQLRAFLISTLAVDDWSAASPNTLRPAKEPSVFITL